jgi:two-component system sensor kinase FixL
MRRAKHILNRVADLKPQLFLSVEQFLSGLPMLIPAPILVNITMSPTSSMEFLRELAVWKIRWPVIVMIRQGDIAMAEGSDNPGPIIVLVTPFSAGELALALGRAFDAIPECEAGPGLSSATIAEARVIAEQRVAEHEVDKFRQALGPFVVAAEATRMAMAFTNANAAGNPLVFANDSFLALTGYTSAEVVGQSFDFLMSEMTDAGDIARISAQFEHEATETIEVECRRRDGRSFLAAIRIIPVHDKSKAIVQHCISFVSLSDHVERARKEREALHALYQHTPDFIFTTEGRDHTFTFVNDAYRRLVGNRDLIGQSVATALPEVVDQGFVALLDQVLASGKPFAGHGTPVILEGEDGPQQRFIDFIYQAVRSPNGEITGIFCEGHDATEQRLCSEQVQTLQADLTKATRASAMGTMAATLAHELNQPLAAISNYAGICARLADLDGKDAAQINCAVNGIIAGARRAAEIIRRLRDMSEQRASHREVFNLKDAIRESIELVRAGSWFRISIDDSDCQSVSIEADRIQIEQVIMNLVRNACEAVIDTVDGQVIISTGVKGQDAIISVRDNGPGVPANATAKLFDQSGSTKPKGMGIGLSICRTIVEAHEGAIWLENGTGGANFCFSVPISPQVS